MTTHLPGLSLASLVSLSLISSAPTAAAQSPPIAEAIIGESNPITPEISTAQLQQILLG